MESEIIKLALSQGIYAVLFVFLLFWVLKENSRRERNYQMLLEKFSDNFDELGKKIDRVEIKIDAIERKSA